MEKGRIAECAASHCPNYSKYHIVWITKQRKPLLKGNIAKRAKELILVICRENGAEIIAGHVGEDHIHFLVSVQPDMSIKKLVQYLKEKTSRVLRKEYKRQYWGGRLWGVGFFIIGSEQVNNECIAKYLKINV